MPPRKSAKGKIEKIPRETPSRKPKDEPIEPINVEFTPSAGWTTDNYLYLKTLPNDQILDKIYEMFGIPLSYKTDKTKSAIQVFAEFHQSAFQFVQQFPETTKALSFIAILSDYISSVPSFSSAKDSFSTWLEKATKQIESLDYSPNEQQAILAYLNKNIRQNAHIVHFVLTKDAVEMAEREGINLFRIVEVDNKSTSEEEARLAAQRQNEYEQQQLMLQKAMKEKKEAEEREKQEKLAKAIQEIMTENFARIQETLEKRNDALVAQLMAIEAQIDASQKKSKPQ